MLTLIQENWSIIFFIGSLIWSYANLKWHVGQLHTRVVEHEQHDKEKWCLNEKEHNELKIGVKEMEPRWQEIRERLVKIETLLQKMQ